MNKTQIETVLDKGEVTIGSKIYNIFEADGNLCKGCHFEKQGCPQVAIDICQTKKEGSNNTHILTLSRYK